MANRYRGDVSLVLGGERLTLRLTLAALAEIEDAFGAQNLSDLGARFAAGGLKARDLVAILGAAARGGGSLLEDHAIAARVPATELPRVAKAVADLLARTFGEGDADRPFAGTAAGRGRRRPSRGVK